MRGAGQLPSPVGQLPLHDLALHPLALPRRVIDILNRQFGQRSHPAGAERIVEDRQFAEENTERPPIGDNVMQVDEQHMFRRIQLDEQGADRFVPRQVKSPARLVMKQPLQFVLAHRWRVLHQADRRHVQRRRFGNHLPGRAIIH